jgi:hypothetical protein
MKTPNASDPTQKPERRDASLPSIPDAAPTSQYQVIQSAFDHFNRELFLGALPHVMLTMDRSRRKSRGSFSWDRFGSRNADVTVHEICLNPNCF